MESGLSWEQKTVVSELSQGVEYAKQLRVQLSNASSSYETKELLVQRILASFEKALMIQNWSHGHGGSSSTMVQLQQPQSVAANSGSGSGVLPESPISINGNSPTRNESFYKESHDNNSNNNNNNHRDVSKKRKLTPSWTEQVKISSDGGLEGSHDDGFSWRKYGQKDILAAKYPRSYYRCTYRNTQDCWATKQMQRSDDDPTVFDITYRGKHTCSSANQSASPPPEKQEKKTDNTNNSFQPEQQSSEQILYNLRQCLRVNTNTNTEELTKETSSTFSFPSISFGCVKAGNASLSTLMIDNNNSSPPYISPAHHESNYFSNFGRIHHYAYRSESDLTEMISANNSVSNSPIPDLDFSAELDHNFLFDNPEFFT